MQKVRSYMSSRHKKYIPSKKNNPALQAKRIDEPRDAFHNNIVYTANNNDAYGIEFLHNPEGYIRYYGLEEHYHFTTSKTSWVISARRMYTPKRGIKSVSSACSIIHQVCHGRRQQVHQSSHGNTTAKSLWRCMAWMSTTAKRVGTILPFAVQPRWTHWRRSIIPSHLMRGAGIIL